MSKNKTYYDRTLIKLKRKYSKDETVAALIKELKEANTHIGKLNSEVLYLENKIKESNENKKIKRRAKCEIVKEELYQKMIDKNEKQKKEIEQLKKIRDNLLSVKQVYK